jgi:hypothetical protein
MSNGVERLNPDKRMCEILGGIIKMSSGIWGGVKSSSISKETFLETQVPQVDDRILANTAGTGDKIALIAEDKAFILENIAKQGGFDRCTNAVLYPPMSMMDWHTNSDISGVRTYFTFTLKEGLFRWVDPITKEIHIDTDDIGWTCRRFKIPMSENHLWHSVWSEGVRFAFGFNTYDTA